MRNLFDYETMQAFGQAIQDARVQLFLGMLANHHPETCVHTIRVGARSMILGNALALDTQHIEYLGLAGLVHDIGKWNIPPEKLSNPLTKEEVEELKEEHIEFGRKMLKYFGNDLVMRVAVAHHQFQKGGYPRKNNERRRAVRGSPDRRNHDPRVNKLAQILAIADQLDPTLHGRSYAPATPPNKVEEEMTKNLTVNPEYLGLAFSMLDGVLSASYINQFVSFFVTPNGQPLCLLPSP